MIHIPESYKPTSLNKNKRLCQSNITSYSIFQKVPSSLYLIIVTNQ